MSIHSFARGSDTLPVPFLPCYYLYFTLAEVLDYRIDSNQVLFVIAPGSQTRCIAVQIVEDDLTEDSEVFFISFSSTSPFVMLPSSVAAVTIIDNGEINCVCEERNEEQESKTVMLFWLDFTFPSFFPPFFLPLSH